MFFPGYRMAGLSLVGPLPQGRQPASATGKAMLMGAFFGIAVIVGTTWQVGT
jgi:hypothetical protein